MSEFFSKIDDSNQTVLQQSIKKKLIENNYQNDPDDNNMAEYVKILINTDVTKDDVYRELKDVIENLQYSFVDWLYEENEKYVNNISADEKDKNSMGVDDNINYSINEKNKNKKRNMDEVNENSKLKSIIRPISPFEEESQPKKKVKINNNINDNNSKKIIRPISPFDENKKKPKYVTIRNSVNDVVDEDEILRKRRLRFQNEFSIEKSNHNKNQNQSQINKNQKNSNHSRKENDMRDNNNKINASNKQTEIQIANIHKRKMNNENKNDNLQNKHTTYSKKHSNTGNNEKLYDKKHKNNRNQKETTDDNNNNNNSDNNTNNNNYNSNNYVNSTNVNFDDNIDLDQMEEKPVRCVFWPNCTKPDCKFWHPKEICKKFPNCPDNDKCLYIHPQVSTTTVFSKFNPYMSYPSVASIAIPCKYGIHCTKINCPYFHSNQVIMPGVDLTKFEDTRSLILCHYYPNCLNANCPFYHPPNPAKTGKGNAEETTNNNETTNISSTENIVKLIPNFSAVYDITKSKIPCRYEPNCNRPNCPYLHTLNSQVNANKHISERGFALDVETEKVLPNKEINKDNVKLSNNIISNINSFQNESNFETTENVDIPSETIDNAVDNLNDQVELESFTKDDS
jgi:hypothetical protein